MSEPVTKYEQMILDHTDEPLDKKTADAIADVVAVELREETTKIYGRRLTDQELDWYKQYDAIHPSELAEPDNTTFFDEDGYAYVKYEDRVFFKKKTALTEKADD